MKDVLACLFFSLICIKDQIQLMFAGSLFKLKLDTKEGTASERIHLHIFIKFIKKIKEKNIEIAEEKMSKGLEENK